MSERLQYACDEHGWCDFSPCPQCPAPSSFAATSGSLAHVHFEIKTEQGNTAMIKGDPNMPEATRNALAAMIDAVVKAANAGELKVPENAEVSNPPPQSK